MDRDSIDRIRSATFPVGRRGYEKREAGQRRADVEAVSSESSP